MNNPESNFMSPLRSQPLKKQRGGSTPSAVSSGKSATGPRPPSASESATDAIARRRAELRRLQEKRSAARSSRNPAATGTAPPPNAMARTPAKSLAEPGIPPLRHTSDIFAKVPKSPGTIDAKLPDMAKPGIQINNIAKIPSLKPPAAPSSGNSITRPPPPPVARKLEYQGGTSRAKNAPASGARRPPPPPPSSGNSIPSLTASRPEPLDINDTVVPAPASAPPTPRAPEPPLSTKAPVQVVTELPTNGTEPPKKSPTSEPPKPEIMTRTPLRPLEPNQNNQNKSLSPKLPPPVVDDAKTPAPVDTPAVPPPSTVRRDKIRSLRDGLGGVSPPAAKDADVSKITPPESQAAVRLEAALKEANDEKLKALKQVAELEGELLQARKDAEDATKAAVPETSASAPPSTPQPKALQRMLQVAESEGEQAALKWARAQVVGVPPLSSESLVLPGSPGARLLGDSMRRRPISTRTTAPHPKLNGGAPPSQSSMVQVERQLIEHFREAATSIPFEFDSNAATFVIRRPYGIETAPELFSSVSLLNHETYSRKAHVSTISTLEVGVVVKLDNGNTTLCLSDVAAIRYSTHEDEEWKIIPNLDQLDRPLGAVTYIDDEGIEKDFNLDELVEEALLVREQYCRTLTSTALAFKDRPPVQVPSSTSETTTTTDKPNVATMGVDTSDIPYPPATIEVKKEEKAKQTSEEQAGSGDVLAIFLGMVFQTLFGWIWWILVGLPLAIVRSTLVTAGVVVILSTMYLYWMDELHNGHGLSFLATTGYHSNAASVGIL